MDAGKNRAMEKGAVGAKATLDEVLEWIHEQAEKAAKKPNPVVDTTEWNEKLQSFVAGISRKKNAVSKENGFMRRRYRIFRSFKVASADSGKRRYNAVCV